MKKLLGGYNQYWLAGEYYLGVFYNLIHVQLTFSHHIDC